MDEHALKAALRQGKVVVTFTKANGDKRVMVATQDPSLLPAAEKNNRATNPNVLVVFDTENNGWRSIKLDSIHTWEVGDKAPDVPPSPPVTPPTIGWTPNKPAPVAPTIDLSVKSQ